MRKSSLALAAWAACLVGNSVIAGTVQLDLVLDPAAVGCNGCTLSGPGTYQLFASASQGDNLGIAGYGISVQNVTTILHRSPRANAPEDSEGNVYPSGFSLLRSANNQVRTGTGFLVGAGQDTIAPTPYLIHGFGQTPGSFYENYVQIFPPPGPPGATQPFWGAPLLLAEGAYGAGPLPFIDLANVDTFVNVFRASGGTVSGAQLTAGTCLGECGPSPGVAPSVADISFRTSVMNEVVNLMPMDSAPGTFPVEWSTLTGPVYTDFSGGSRPALVGVPPTWDPVQQKFIWITAGSPMGNYVWTGTVSNSVGSDSFSLQVTVFYPEPATFSLVGLAALGCLGMFRRRI